MRMQRLARWLLPKMIALSEGRKSDFDIINGEDKEVYLRRWWIIPRNPFMNVYLHNMLHDDGDVLHDHMYVSVSLVLDYGLQEVYCLDPESGFIELRKRCRTFEQGQVVFRSSRMAHQLLVRRPTWTIFVTGPRIKSWGFWCPKGWKEWKEYVALSNVPDGSGRGKSTVGVGCGEMS